MNKRFYLALSNARMPRITKTRPNLQWDEICCELNIQVPDELFKRPLLKANVIITDMPNTAYDADVILNTKEMIEQQTGAKIEFTVIRQEHKEE